MQAHKRSEGTRLSPKSRFSTIRINKIKTDNFLEIYKHLADLNLPVSAMDIRKVQSIVKEIYAGGDIKVTITEDIDALRNGEKILAIGSLKMIMQANGGRLRQFMGNRELQAPRTMSHNSNTALQNPPLEGLDQRGSSLGGFVVYGDYYRYLKCVISTSETAALGE